MYKHYFKLIILTFSLILLGKVDSNAQCSNIFQFAASGVAANCLASDGSIAVANVLGGSGAYAFSLSGGPASAPSIPPNNHIFPNLSAGVYSITISDGNCDTTVLVTVPITGSIVDVNVIATPTSCASNTGSITITHQPAGLIVASYDILPDPNSQNPNTTGVFNNLPDDTYGVILTDANGCVFNVPSIKVDLPVITDADIVVTPIICKGALGIIEVNGVTGGIAPFQYKFDNKPASSINTLEDVLQGPHTILITDANGCSYTEGVIVDGSQTELKDCNAGKDTTVFFGENVTLRATKGLGSIFWWAPGEIVSDSSILSPIAFPPSTTTYTFHTRTAEGCECIDRVTVKVIPLIKIPNTFTPNQDGVNDVWIIDNTQNYDDVELNVYNRWGDRVYFVKDYEIGKEWDGGSLPEATYYYVLRFKYPDESKIYEYTGGITIVR
jgi:gliding motility-associated-like protein